MTAPFASEHSLPADLPRRLCPPDGPEQILSPHPTRLTTPLHSSSGHPTTRTDYRRLPPYDITTRHVPPRPTSQPTPRLANRLARPCLRESLQSRRLSSPARRDPNDLPTRYVTALPADYPIRSNLIPTETTTRHIASRDPPTDMSAPPKAPDFPAHPVTSLPIRHVSPSRDTRLHTPPLFWPNDIPFQPTPNQPERLIDLRHTNPHDVSSRSFPAPTTCLPVSPHPLRRVMPLLRMPYDMPLHYSPSHTTDPTASNHVPSTARPKTPRALRLDEPGPNERLHNTSHTSPPIPYDEPPRTKPPHSRPNDKPSFGTHNRKVPEMASVGYDSSFGGVFQKYVPAVWKHRYRATLRFQDIAGGVPSDPKVATRSPGAIWLRRSTARSSCRHARRWPRAGSSPR